MQLSESRVSAESADSVSAEAVQPPVELAIARVRVTLERAKASELDRLYRRLPGLDEDSREAICRFADSLVANMLRPPLNCLRGESQNGPPHRLMDALQRLFRLND